MVIFNSYVKLPEGTHQQIPHENQGFKFPKTWGCNLQLLKFQPDPCHIRHIPTSAFSLIHLLKGQLRSWFLSRDPPAWWESQIPQIHKASRFSQRFSRVSCDPVTLWPIDHKINLSSMAGDGILNHSNHHADDLGMVPMGVCWSSPCQAAMSCWKSQSWSWIFNTHPN